MMQDHYKGLAHVAVFTQDMEASIAFYEKIGGTLDQRAELTKPEGVLQLALVNFAGITIELLQPPGPAPKQEGNIPHIAVYVDDVDATAADIRAAGIDTFMTPAKDVLPTLFGGMENWFFKGPNGEQIELMKML